MKKNTFILAMAFCLCTVSSLFFFSKENTNNISSQKALHQENILKNPFKETLKLTKNERKAFGITPNKYNEEQWVLTMNPVLGRPTPIKVAQLQKKLLEDQKTYNRAPGDSNETKWISRGPDNVGGRTRALMFDPNDTTNETVFAGGVNGGLWKNDNISNEASTWIRVGIPENLAVSTINFDPNNQNIFYVGTGESYVGHTDGSVNGDGIWKSIDGGATWENIFGGNDGVSYFVSSSNMTINTPANIAGNYESFPTTNFGPTITTAITADFILANDTTGAATEACTSFGADATGKIAIIRRGECAFVDKVKNAQNAGAIAVIIMNNVSGEPIPMGGTDATITIPAVMISKEYGDSIEAVMNSGTVNGTLNPAEGTFTATVVPGVQHINDIKINNKDGVSEIYVAAADASYGSSNAATTVGGLSYGLYKSIDGGATWSNLAIPLTADGNKHCPNDIEIGADGRIWLSTTTSKLFGDGGGEIFVSSDGTNFSKKYTVTGAGRTQIAASSTDANKIYILAELTAGGVAIKKTTDGFNLSFLTKNMTLPDDADTGIEAGDFTRGQAFYDLLLEVDPNNDEVLYTGGIDLFKSTNGSTAWTQLSHWYGGWGFPEVHADQHIAAFGHNDSNKIIFANDGGVTYSGDGGTTMLARNKGFVTSQFYTVAVGPTTAYTGDCIAGGLQDNGTQLMENANTTATDSSVEIYGGDGAFTFIDQDGTDRYLIRNYVYNDGINLYNFDGANVTINNESTGAGAFINPQALDSNLDILYSNYSLAGVYTIKRYSGIKSAATLTKTDLTDALLTTTPTAFTVSRHTTTSSTLLVGTVLGDILLVENANTDTPTWTNLDQRKLVGSVSDIEFGTTENNIFVTMHNYGVNNVWYSGDKGATWQAKDGDLPDLPVKTILQNPLNLEEVIIGTELGVWYTSNFSDANPTWKNSYNGMSNVKVLDLDMRDDYMVFAATHGRGVFSGQFTANSLSVIAELISTQNIKIFPTVSRGEIFITSNNSIENTKLEIYNLNGQRVHSEILNLSNNKTELNLTSLKAGIYLVNILKDGKQISSKIIIE
jgi:hypothetical protein